MPVVDALCSSCLRAAYEHAVEQVEQKFDLSKVSPDAQNEVVNAGVEPASQEVAERLGNALLDTLFDGVIPGKASLEEQVNLREEFRGHIRGTEGYNKMILSGDGNISRVLNDLSKWSACMRILSMGSWRR